MRDVDCSPTRSASSSTSSSPRSSPSPPRKFRRRVRTVQRRQESAYCSEKLVLEAPVKSDYGSEQRVREYDVLSHSEPSMLQVPGKRSLASRLPSNQNYASSTASHPMTKPRQPYTLVAQRHRVLHVCDARQRVSPLTRVPTFSQRDVIDEEWSTDSSTSHQYTRTAATPKQDLAREQCVDSLVRSSTQRWQRKEEDRIYMHARGYYHNYDEDFKRAKSSMSRKSQSKVSNSTYNNSNMHILCDNATSDDSSVSMDVVSSDDENVMEILEIRDPKLSKKRTFSSLVEENDNDNSGLDLLLCAIEDTTTTTTTTNNTPTSAMSKKNELTVSTLTTSREDDMGGVRKKLKMDKTLVYTSDECGPMSSLSKGVRAIGDGEEPREE